MARQMNERIKELAEQCWSKRPEGQLHFDNEKFAELIVQECAEIARLTEDDDGDDYKSGRSWAGIDILKHFGVAE
jgi:hypothetical protein